MSYDDIMGQLDRMARGARGQEPTAEHLAELKKIRIATELQAALLAHAFFEEREVDAACKKLAPVIHLRASQLTRST